MYSGLLLMFAAVSSQSLLSYALCEPSSESHLSSFPLNLWLISLTQHLDVSCKYEPPAINPSHPKAASEVPDAVASSATQRGWGWGCNSGIFAIFVTKIELVVGHLIR